MKAHWLQMLLAGVMACALVGCARAPKALSDEEAYQRFVGTWVNTEYAGTPSRSQVTVKKTWVDGKGNTYCQFDINYLNGHFSRTALMRVDKKRKAWEINSREVAQGLSAEELEPIERIDSQMANYWIYYRK